MIWFAWGLVLASAAWTVLGILSVRAERKRLEADRRVAMRRHLRLVSTLDGPRRRKSGKGRSGLA